MVVPTKHVPNSQPKYMYVCVCVCPCSRYVKFKVSWNYGKGFEVSWIMERTLNMCVCVPKQMYIIHL